MSYRNQPSVRVDDYPDPQREREQVREERWTRFVGIVREMLERADSPHGVLWAAAMLQRMHPHTSFECDMRDFADEFGWADTVTAIGRAMREHERDRRELVDRR